MSADARRVAVLGDCPLLRHGVAKVVEAADGLTFVLGTGSVDEALAVLGPGDVVLVDLQLSPACLAEVVARLVAHGLGVLVVSSAARKPAPASPSSGASPDGPALRADLTALHAGARGCLSRRADERELLAAIRLVAGGCSYVSADLAVGPGPDAAPACRVTDRERQILELIAHGETDHAIAVRLGISEHTVHSHLDRLRDKIGSRRRADLTRFAITHDLITTAS
ncbi:response regulator transcription factor [Streptomyces sp. NBC_00249]|uniref:response regulator transcription factor n=1 Tax=Streptomyces sp. NBC_00249 TaxID=2975690 RepID=UPI002256DD2B|nr:response regulator transcription factor [Streptomyces sp. NBC_00249]MCX5195445.1 response regulator transcription factor [Streptomyces sp. NBC_00249]